MKLSISSLKKSPKKEGEFEKEIIEKVREFMEDENYEVMKHATINVAWEAILYEIDLLAFRQGEITAVEVKSGRDKISRLKTQIGRLRPIVDYGYVASDQSVDAARIEDDLGIILTGNGKVVVKRHAHRINEKVTSNTLMKLKKKCLVRLCHEEKITQGLWKGLTKEEIASNILTELEPDVIRSKVRWIVFCSQQCETCPISKHDIPQSTIKA